MLRRRSYDLPVEPSGIVQDSVLYVMAPWHKDMSQYNREIDRDGLENAKIQGIYGFRPKEGYIYGGMSFNSHDNMEIDKTTSLAIESLFYISSDIEYSNLYYIFMGAFGYGTYSLSLSIYKSSGDYIYPNDRKPRQEIRLPINQWIHYLATWEGSHGKVFVNGELVVDDALDTLYMNKLPSPTIYNIMGSNKIGYGSYGVPGYVGYVKVWNYAKNFDMDGFVPDI